jgi:hypothetical protein
MTTIPFCGQGTPSPDNSSKQTILIPVNTCHLVLLKRGTRYYVSLPTLASIMQHHSYDQGMGVLSYLLHKTQEILPAHGIIRLPEQGNRVKMDSELIALSLPAALTMLSRSNIKDVWKLHDILMEQFERLYAPHTPENVEQQE